MCFPEDLSDHSWKPKSPFWQVLTKEPCRVLVSLMMITVCLCSIEDFSLHSPPQNSAPPYGNPWVSCSLNHDWDCQGFWHCPGRLCLPSEHTLHSAGTAGCGHRCSISSEHVARHRVECNRHLSNEWKRSFCIFCLTLEGRLQVRLHLLHLHHLLLATNN